MKKLTLFFSGLVCLVLSFNTFAYVRVENPCDGLSSQTPFVGKIAIADYLISSKEPKLLLTVVKAPGEQISLAFGENDLPFGMTLVNSIGKTLIVSFKNASYEINSLTMDMYPNKKN